MYKPLIQEVLQGWLANSVEEEDGDGRGGGGGGEGGGYSKQRAKQKEYHAFSNPAVEMEQKVEKPMIRGLP